MPEMRGHTSSTRRRTPIRVASCRPTPTSSSSSSSSSQSRQAPAPRRHACAASPAKVCPAHRPCPTCHEGAYCRRDDMSRLYSLALHVHQQSRLGTAHQPTDRPSDRSTDRTTDVVCGSSSFGQLPLAERRILSSLLYSMLMVGQFHWRIDA